MINSVSVKIRFDDVLGKDKLELNLIANLFCM